MANISIESKLVNSMRNGLLGDAFFKMLANIVSTIIRNIIVLPLLAKFFLTSQYGEIVTAIGLITTISAGFGNALLSTRLIMDEDYRRRSIEGDFNLICIAGSCLTAFACLPICRFFPTTCGSHYVLIAFLLFVETFVGYHSGWFILRQEYRRLLIYTIFSGIGFGIGLLITKVTGIWITTYLLSDLFSFSFLVKFSPLVKEKITITPMIKMMLLKYGALIFSTIISNAIAYMDRLFLHPIIGSEAVAVYTTASVFGKAFNLIALPISSILLGYYAVGKIQLNLKRYWIINVATLGALFVFIIVTIVLGKWFTGMLYPSLIDDAAPFILIANLSSAIGASAQITKSAALKYAKLYWSLIIQALYSVLYIGLGYKLVILDGLRGFSHAVLIANLVQIILLYIVCTIVMRNKDKQDGIKS